MSDYAHFVESKRLRAPSVGIDPGDMHPSLFEWQSPIVRWALRKGRAALFEDCGLGKTIQELEWARHIPGDVILFAPLAVAEQTEREAARFGIDAHVSRDGTKRGQITVTNYEKMHRFDLSAFTGIVLDESSLLKSTDGKYRTALIEAAQSIPYRLACTATPAPNDTMELANHAEFLGVMTRGEMLARFFVHDGGKTSDWRLKGHAVGEFWRWVATWAVMVRTPADIGYDATGYVLPPLRTHEHIIESGIRDEGQLFALPATSLNDQRRARGRTIDARVAEVASLVNSTPGPWVVWCELNAEGDALTAAIDGAIQVTGTDDEDERRESLTAFADGRARVLVSKAKITGHGLNWQHCAQTAYVGLSHSWEQFYQSVRRFWRFGQANPVDVHVFSTDVEIAVLQSIKEKQAAADDMAAQMVGYMKDTMREELTGLSAAAVTIETGAVETGDSWTMHHGDCVDVVSRMPSESIGYSIFSPPFASLYTYTDDLRDMGNTTDGDEFARHFGYLVPELYRVTKPGRLVSLHCMNLPTSKARDGVIGLRDFRGELIEIFRRSGWIFHSEVCIWKDPVTAMQRTKALGLLHKQIRKDSCMSRQGIPDYLVTMRKPGDNPEPVTHDDSDLPVSLWQRYASPVWMDINPSDTLQYRSAREHEDERHVCPLQFDVIRRGLQLWSNPGDLVLSPFAGIGSEGYVALEMGRRFVGVELKPSYFKQACANLDASRRQLGLAI